MAKSRRPIRISPVVKSSRLKHSEKVVGGLHVTEAPTGDWLVHKAGGGQRKALRFSTRDEAIGYAKEFVSSKRPVFIHTSDEPVKVLTSKRSRAREASAYVGRTTDG